MLYAQTYQGSLKFPDVVYNMRNGIMTELYTDISPLPTKENTSVSKEFPDMF